MNRRISGARQLRSERPFNGSALRSILANEAYAGDRRIPKTPARGADGREAAEPVRYIRGDHEAIVSREIWDRAQARLKGGFSGRPMV